MIRYPIIPEFITVHLGGPDEAARNIEIPFTEYIKNVASGEIYPTWPESAIKANIYAIISFTLNRIYNEWYRSRGYNFDITNSSMYDQSFEEDRQFFENIYNIVNEIFTNYIVRDTGIQPLFATYCDGRKTKCNGLSQWGSFELANKGYTPIEILKYYYGNNIEIKNAKIGKNIKSYPGYKLELGDAGDDIKLIKKQINRIGRNYPSIPTIIKDNVYFDIELYNSLIKFQEIFNLKSTGIIDEETWYRIKYLYNAVKNISDLYAEGITIEDAELEYPAILELGVKGKYIRDLNYYLNVIAYFYPDVLFTKLEGEEFNKTLENAVISFQNRFNLEPTGKVDRKVWKIIRDAYKETINNVPKKYLVYINEFFPGRYLSRGMEGEDVINLQRFLYMICENNHEIPGVIVNGKYDSLTEKSIKYIQEKTNLNVNGVTTAATWYNIVEMSKL